MNREVAIECARLSEAEKISFPEVARRLDKEGIEAYEVNLLIPNKVYYQGNESFQLPVNLKAKPPSSAIFNGDKVIQAIRSTQSQQIGYQEFIDRILQAGVIFYAVFIKGKKVIYFGRNGEQHIELFPS